MHIENAQETANNINMEQQTAEQEERQQSTYVMPDIPDPNITVRNLDMYYGEKQALLNIHMDIAKNRVTAFIGPSGCGKSTLLRCFNRLNDLVDEARVEGEILIEGEDIYDKSVDISDLRKNVGMVFQKSNPFPKSIYENVAYGAKIAGITNKPVLDDIVEKSLKGAALWEEVNERLHESALGLSGGQMQRLCIARAIAVEPKVLLMDEPCSALDPIATGRIEDLINELKDEYTIVIVTHNMQQASRVSDFTAFMYLGELIEYDTTETIFLNPKKKQTEDYVSGKFG